MEGKKKKTFFKSWCFIVLVIIVIIGATGCGKEDVPKVSDNSGKVEEVNAGDKETSDEPIETETPEFFALEETVETKKIRATATKIEKLAGSQFNKPADGNEFVLLYLEIENISDKELTISSMMSFNAYVDDTSINQSLSAQIAKEGTSTVDGTIAAGKKLKGVLGYEVSKDWSQIEVHFEPDMFDGTTIKWLIENE